MRIINSFGWRLHYHNQWYYSFKNYDFKYLYNKLFILELFLLFKLKKIFDFSFFRNLYSKKKEKSKKGNSIKNLKMASNINTISFSKNNYYYYKKLNLLIKKVIFKGNKNNFGLI